MRPKVSFSFATFGVVVLLVLTAARPTQASTIFSQPYQGPNNSFISDSGFDQFIADDFTLLFPSNLTDFHWWGAYNTGADPADAPATDSFTLEFYPDLASLQSFTGGSSVSLTNLSRSFTGDLTPFGNAIFEYSADFLVPLFLDAGSYYALLYSNPAATRWGWESIPVGNTWSRSQSGVWAQQTFGQAFEITGETVPEPATLLLLGTGLGLAAARRRKKTQFTFPVKKSPPK